jgi:hypothetical protein
VRLYTLLKLLRVIGAMWVNYAAKRYRELHTAGAAGSLTYRCSL